MLGYQQAYKIACLPFPIPITQLSTFLLLIIVLIVPILIEKFTTALIFSPLLTFSSVFGMLMIHCVALQLEMPFGDDFVDLPMLEMHDAFNSSLLLFYIAKSEVEHPLHDYFVRKKPKAIEG